MKKYFIISLIVILVTAALYSIEIEKTKAAITFVQCKMVEQSSTSTTVTLDSAVGAGNFLYVGVRWTSETITISSITGNSNTYTDEFGPTIGGGGSYRAQGYYVMNANSGSTSVVVTLSSFVENNVVVCEWSGVATSAAFDVGETGIGTSTETPLDSGDGESNANANSLLIGYAVVRNDPGSPSFLTATFGGTAADGIRSSGTRIALQDLVVSSAATRDAQVSTTSNAFGYLMRLAIFKQAAAAAPDDVEIKIKGQGIIRMKGGGVIKIKG